MVGEEGTRLTVAGGPGSSFFGQAAGWGGWFRWPSIDAGARSPVRKGPGPTPSEGRCRGPKGRPALSRLDAGRPGGTVAGNGSSARHRLLTVRRGHGEGPRARALPRDVPR